MKRLKNLLCLVLCALFVFGAVLPAFAECEHAYTATPYPASCTEEGYLLLVCSKCGDTQKTEFQKPTGHSYGQWSVAQKTTCVQEGLWERTCDYCGAVETKTVPVLDHADANADGKCDVCGKEMPIEKVFSPFDWFVALFRTIAEKLQGLFKLFAK